MCFQVTYKTQLSNKQVRVNMELMVVMNIGVPSGVRARARSHTRTYANAVNHTLQ